MYQGAEPGRHKYRASQVLYEKLICEADHAVHKPPSEEGQAPQLDGLPVVHGWHDQLLQYRSPQANCEPEHQPQCWQDNDQADKGQH